MLLPAAAQSQPVVNQKTGALAALSFLAGPKYIPGISGWHGRA